MKRSVEILATVMALMFSHAAFSEKPSYLAIADGQPVVAVFEGINESYALGCEALAKRWDKIPTRKLDLNQWNEQFKKIPVVADVYCDARTKKYGSTGEPGSFVFTHRDGKVFRHYVDNFAWFNAVSGSYEAISPEELVKRAPNKGPDFESLSTSDDPIPDCICADRDGNTYKKNPHGCKTKEACENWCNEMVRSYAINPTNGMQVFCRNYE